MRGRQILAIFLSLALALAFAAPATAGKKKGPKPYKSEEGIILVPHTLLVSSTNQVNSVTAREFENRCAIPASNGLDAYVYEVPKEYQKIEADFVAKGKAQIAWDLYAFFYDANCKRSPVQINASGAITQQDAQGIMPAGTTYVLIADFAGDPAIVHYELKPRK